MTSAVKMGIKLEQMELVEIQISFEKERIQRYLQYKIRERKGGYIDKYISNSIQEIKGLMNPLGGYIIREMRSVPIVDTSVPGPVMEADLIAFCISTIGSGPETRVDDLLNAGDLFKGMILDALGSAAVSELSAKMAEIIYVKAKAEGLNTTRAFSPGAGSSHWDIKHQRFIFENIDASRLGVQLTPSYMMVPKKSISFIIGLGENIEQAPHLFSCEGCRRERCPYRHIPGKEEGVETESRDTGG